MQRTICPAYYVAHPDGSYSLAAPQPLTAGQEDDSDFSAWLSREMPTGTVIGDPSWWARKIASRLAASALATEARVKSKTRPNLDDFATFDDFKKATEIYDGNRAAGTPSVTVSISDDKGFPEVLSEFVRDVKAGKPFGSGSMTLTRYIDVWAARRVSAAGAPAETPKQALTYSRLEVQKWRDDVAHAAADMVQRVAPSFGDGDWSWLVNDIRGLAAQSAPAPSAGADVEKDTTLLEALTKIDNKLTYAINSCDGGVSTREFMSHVRDARNDLVRVWLPMKSAAAMLAASSPAEAG